MDNYPPSQREKSSRSVYDGYTKGLVLARYGFALH